MSDLADFLDRERDEIVSRFVARAKVTAAPAGTTETQLVDHLPILLDSLAESVRDDKPQARQVFAHRAPAASHGRQRARVGYDIHGLVQEFGLLRDCIFERLEHCNVSPTVRELRILSAGFSAATTESVEEYVAAHRANADLDRQHLLGMFQQAPGFVCFLRGPELKFELANAAYLQLVGQRDILGKTVREALPEVAGQGYFELLDRVFQSNEPFVGRGIPLTLQLGPDGPMREAFLDFVYQPIVGDDGITIGILVQGQDVTDSKRLEEQRALTEAALRASELRYRSLFDSIDDGYCLMQIIFDAASNPVDYRFLETNAAFEGQTGLRDAIGKTARELVPDLDASWFQRYGKVALTGESHRFESHAPAMGRWFEAYASRVGPAELHQVALVFKDISDRKRADNEREQMLLMESAARQKAEEASRLKDEFLATVSHELRTPLSAMLGWVQLLRGGGLPIERRERALETIERNARAQAQLIEDLLDVSRILAGKLRLQTEPVDTQAVVEAALETVKPAAEAKGIRLQTTLDTECTVLGDVHRLQQVVWNLLSNAVKFTPKGGRVHVVVQRRDSSVEIRVSDSGKGIDATFLPHVFERFRQAEGGTTRAYGGLGLGLSIVRQLVELHGGTVAVFSDGDGQGATFTVRLPISALMRRASIVPPHLPALDGAEAFKPTAELDGIHVLVVDDEEDSREMLRSLLEGCGARVRLAGSVEEGLRLFAADSPDVLLSDIGMPGEDGYSFITKIRHFPPEAGGNVPAVALTAYARAEDRLRALRAGFNNHVPKPVEPFELLTVMTALSSHLGKGRV